MAASPLRLDFGLTSPALSWPTTSSLRQMPGLVPGIGWLVVLSYPVGKTCRRTSLAASGGEGVTPEELQETLWQDLFGNHTHWSDNRLSKLTPRSPHFMHKILKVPLWLNNRHKPGWVDSQLVKLDAGRKTHLDSVPPSALGQGSVETREGCLDIGTCRKLCENGRISDAVDALNRLVQQGCHVDQNLYYRILKRCIVHKDLTMGRRIHALTAKSGFEGNSFLATHLICLYASNGRLEEAMQVFSKVRTPSTYNWVTIILACGRQGEAAQVIWLYRRMVESATVKPGNYAICKVSDRKNGQKMLPRVYVAVLKACATAGDLVVGKEVHAHILASPGKPDIFVQTGLVSMYAKCSSLVDARRLFDRLPERDVVAWTAMLAGYSQQGMGQDALSLYSSMQQEGLAAPDSVTFVCLLQACASVGVGALDQGKQLHSQIRERGLDSVLGRSLVNMYAKCGSLEDARQVFDRLPERNVGAWNAMLAGYAQQGRGQEALSLYSSIERGGLTTPDSVTFVCLLQACANVGVGALDQGKQLHLDIQERGLQEDLVLGGSLVNMYAKCGRLKDARWVFDRLPEKNVVAWNVMLAGYAQQGMGQEALSLYNSMQQEDLTTPDSVSYVCLLQACASVGVETLDLGKQLHSDIQERGLQHELVLGGSLVNMYAKCGNLGYARQVFDRLPEKNVVAWTAMLAGYAQQGMCQEALSLYSIMQQEGLTTPGPVTYVCLLQACTSLAALSHGKLLHSHIKERGLQNDVVVGAALVNMYAKCGSMFDSQQVFDSLPERNMEAWGALIDGYSRQGDSEVVFDLVDRMRLEGIQLDGVTFLCVLTACSHVGAVDKGRKYFEALKSDYGISPTMEHYTCMVDLLGRAGHLDEALQIAKAIPFQPTTTLWHTLLGACQKWNNVQIGLQAFEFAVGLDAEDVSSYVSMSNIYASAQMWEEAKELRRKKSRAWKKPAQSWWTDIGGAVHTFVAEDKKHPNSEGMHGCNN